MSSTMRSMTLQLFATLACATLAAASARADQPIDPPGRVARISAAVGAVSLAPAGSDAWVSDVVNRPLTNDDRLWSDRDSRAEVHVGSTAIRLGPETGLGILNIDDRTVQLRLTSGTVQISVRALAPEQTFEIATPSASVAVLTPGSYRIDVNDSGEQLRTAVRRGQLAVTDANQATSVQAGQLAEFYGTVDQAQLGPLPADDALDQWAADRDRREERAASTRYVSREVSGYEDLDDYGTWRTVDEYGSVWVPQVRVGWSPYRDGHWAWIAPWGWTWIDDAPWGFAPSHYGRWLHLGGDWCWAPGPRHHAPYYAPALVAWVGGPRFSVGISIGGPSIGWFPLGWNEVYVPSYQSSRGYQQNVNITNINVTNTYVTNYIDRDREGDRGRDRRGDARQPVRYANLGVTGAVIATSQENFSGAKHVGEHLSRLPAGALERATANSAAPAIAPSRESMGRPTGTTPPRSELWTRPVIARTPPPAPAQSFDAQRRAVVANGGRPAPMQRAPGTGADRLAISANPRPDNVRVIREPAALPSVPPTPASPPVGVRGPGGARPGMPGDGIEQRGNRAPPSSRLGASPDARQAPPPPREAPAVRSDRPLPPESRSGTPRESTPPAMPSREAPASRNDRPAPREAPVIRNDRPPQDLRQAAPRDLTPPQAPAPVRQAPAIRNDRPPPQEYRPATPRESAPPQAPPVRNDRPPPQEARQAPPRVWSPPPAPPPVREAPAIRNDRPPPQEYRPAAPREWTPPSAPVREAPAVREFRPPPPPPVARPAPPAAPAPAAAPADKPHPDRPRGDPRDR